MENFGKDPRGVPVDQRWSNQPSNQPHDGAGGVPPRQGTVPEFPSEAWQNVSGAAYCQYPPLPPNNRYDYVVQPDVAPDSASTSRRGSAQEQTEEFTIHARTLEKLVADYIEHDDSTYVPDPALLHPEIRKKKPEFTICGKDLDQLMEEYVSSPEEYNPTSTHAEGSFQEQKESSAFQESHSGQRMDEHVRRKDGYCYSPVKKRSSTYHVEPQRHRHVEGDQRADGSYAIPSTSKDSKQERPISRNLAQLAKQLINNSPKLSRDHDFRTEACYYHYRRCFDVDISDESDGSESSEEGQEHHVGAPGVDSKKKERRQRRENQQASEAETAKKTSAEVYFRNRSYKCALEQYNYLLKIHPNNEKYLVSRSTCHMMMRNHCEAINDLRDALAIHSKFLKGYYRLLVFCLITGRIEGIFTFFVAMEEIYASDPMLAAAREGVRKLEKYVLLESQAREKKSYTLAQACIERILNVSPCNIKYKLRKAQYLAYEGNFESSDKIARSILEYDKNNAMAKYVLSLHMYQIDLQETLEFLKPVILRTPKLLQAVNLYHRTKTILNFIERGTVASQGGQLRDAHHFYVQALRIDSFNRNLKLSVLNKMAVISHQLGMYAQAMSECDRVLQIDQNNIAALATRGKCHMELRNYELAANDYDKCCSISGSAQYRKQLMKVTRKQQDEEAFAKAERDWIELEEAAREATQGRDFHEYFIEMLNIYAAESLPTFAALVNEYTNWWRCHTEQGAKMPRIQPVGSGDHYATLELTPLATEEEIKIAYRRLAKIHHPDRHVNASQGAQQSHELKMKRITQACRALLESMGTKF